MLAAEEILRIFYDSNLNKESDRTETGDAVIVSDVVLMPGQTLRQTIYIHFTPFQKSHVYELHSAVAEGDARVLRTEKEILKAGEVIPIEIEWTGRLTGLKDLQPHAARLRIEGRLVAPAW